LDIVAQRDSFALRLHSNALPMAVRSVRHAHRHEHVEKGTVDAQHAGTHLVDQIEIDVIRVYAPPYRP
jgi:hypothetical protein